MPGTIVAACSVDGTVAALGMMGMGDLERMFANRFILKASERLFIMIMDLITINQFN